MSCIKCYFGISSTFINADPHSHIFLMDLKLEEFSSAEVLGKEPRTNKGIRRESLPVENKSPPTTKTGIITKGDHIVESETVG